MALTSRVRSWWHQFGLRRQRVTKPLARRRRQSCKPTVEGLEDRVTPALITSPLELDGNALDSNAATALPDDWNTVFGTGPNLSPFPVARLFITDGTGNTDDVFFTGSSKDDLDITNWKYTTGSVPDKDDILHAFAAAYVDTSSGSPELLLYFGMDLFATNGTATVGFWFFQDQVAPNGSGGFTGSHQVGDVLVLADFSNGGSVATVRVFKWVGSGGSNGTLDEIPVDATKAYAVVNTSATAAPWSYTPKSGPAGTFQPGAFFEGGINLTKLLGVSGTALPCDVFHSFLAETRASNSVNSTLKDFALGDIQVHLCDINLVKKVNGDDANTAPGVVVSAGSSVTFTYFVSNPGAVPLSNITVSDDNGTPGNLADDFSPTAVLAGGFNIGDTNTNGLLDPGETWQFTATRTAVAGQYTNTATASGIAPDNDTVTDDDPANYFGNDPGVQIVKYVNGHDANTAATAPQVGVGSTVTFTYVVTNTGNVPLSNVTVTDDKLGTITSFTGDTNNNGLLDLTETWIFTTTATAVAGLQTNTGTVTAKDSLGTSVTDDDPANYFGANTAIRIIKYVNGQDADLATGPHVLVGSTVTFTYVVTNTGNVPLANVTVTDDKLGTITSFTGDTNNNGLLDLTETWTFTKTTTAVAGQQTNIGTVTAENANDAEDTVTDDNPANYFGDDPGIQIIKYVNGQDADTTTGPHVLVGSTVTFTYVVTNTGNVPLSNVSVTDDKLGAITSFTGDTNNNGLLDLTETWIFTKTATAAVGLQTNTGTVTAKDSFLPSTTVTDNDPANYFGEKPGIQLIKSVAFSNGLAWNDANNNGLPDVGETIHYSFTVKNTGNVTLTNVRVIDPKVQVIGGPITLAPGASNSTHFTGIYRLTVADVQQIRNLGSAGFPNTAVAVGTPPRGPNVTHQASASVRLPAVTNAAALSSLSGFVYLDRNNNGRKDVGEPGIPGVLITLSGFDTAGRRIVRQVRTNAGGAYLFSGLFPGVYSLRETQPSSFLDGRDTIGTQGGRVSNDLFYQIVLQAFTAGRNNNFGERAALSKSNFLSSNFTQR